jgi:dTDP-4-dehydrorhamnose reductase
MYSTPLIIGCDSFIGRALFQYFNSRTTHVVGTTRRAKTSHLYLNLDEEWSLWQLPRSVGVAYLCAGITDLESCEKYSVRTRYINVERTQMLIDKILAQGTYVVFLSSDLAEQPTTEYGFQKQAVERYLTGKNATVVRLGKVITAEAGLLAGWVGELEAGRPIEPFDDYYFAPINLEKVVAVLGDEEWLGVHPKILITAIEPLTYFRAIDFIAEKRALDRSLIVPKSSGVKKPGGLALDRHLKEYRFSAWDTLTELFGVDALSYEDS